MTDDPIAWAAAQAGSDPVRQRVLAALARRAAAQPPGALREALLARLQRRAQAESPPPPARPDANAPRPLTELLARLLAAAGPELRNAQAHRHRWNALRVARHMAEVAAPVPEHLGPLNGQVLATRALQQLQALAPGYLQRLLTQLDDLAALAPLLPAEKPARRR